MRNIFIKTIDLLRTNEIKYNFMEFDSGVIMLDIWHNNKFYVIQFEDFIGFSEIDDENIGFDTVPDQKFDNEKDFFERLYSVIYEGQK